VAGASRGILPETELLSRIGLSGTLPRLNMDYEVQRCTRHCAASGRLLAEGEEFYSVLVTEHGQVQRYDYAAGAWPGPPEAALGWWKSRMPTRDSGKPRLAPGDVLLELFVSLEQVPDKLDMRYVLALLLVRRRVLRLEETRHDETGRELLLLYSPRDETTYQVRSAMPSDERIREIQVELGRLLYAGAE